MPLSVFKALKASCLATMAFSKCSFHHQVSRHQWLGWVVRYTSSVVLSSPALMLFQIFSVAASAAPADMLTCKLKNSWKWLLVWGYLSFQTLRWGVNFHLDFGDTSILMLHTRNWCCRATSLPGITYICDKFAHGPTAKDEVSYRKGWSLCGYVSWLVLDKMAVTFLETCSQEAGQMLGQLFTPGFSHPQQQVKC